MKTQIYPPVSEVGDKVPKGVMIAAAIGIAIIGFIIYKKVKNNGTKEKDSD